MKKLMKFMDFFVQSLKSYLKNTKVNMWRILKKFIWNLCDQIFRRKKIKETYKKDSFEKSLEFLKNKKREKMRKTHGRILI